MRVKLMLFAASILSVCSLALAQAPDAREADHQALRALLKDVTAAINGQQLDKLSALFAREFCFTTSDQTVITTQEGIKDYYAKLFSVPGAPLTSVTVTPQADVLTQFVGENVGLCRGHSGEKFVLKSGETIDLTSAWTATLIKEDGVWKVAAAHVGVNFLDNPIIAKVTATNGKTALGGAAIGLAVGALVGLFVRRRKTA
jgi:hypothetical protein